MKLHSEIDLITNSSSSVFIFSLKEKPKDVQHLMNLLFPGEPKDSDFSIYGDSFKIEELCEIVFNEIKDRQVNSLDDIIKIFKEGGFPGQDYGPYKWDINEIRDITKDFKRKNPGKEILNDCEYSLIVDAIWKKHLKQKEIENGKKLLIEAKELWEKMKNGVIYEALFSDNDSKEGAIEQGDFFNGVPHIRISQH